MLFILGLSTGMFLTMILVTNINNKLAENLKNIATDMLKIASYMEYLEIPIAEDLTILANEIMKEIE